MSEPRQGRIIWRELLSVRPEAAADFYRELFGWSVTEGRGQRWLWQGRSRIAGLSPLPADGVATPASVWLVYVTVDDLAATLDGARRRGIAAAAGPVVDATSKSRFAVLGHRRGALTAPIEHDDAAARPAEPAPARGADGRAIPMPPVGHFCWHQLNSGESDLAAFETDFATLFGWKLDQRTNGSAQRGTFYVDGVPVAGLHTMPEKADAPDHWLPFVRVADVRAAAAEAAANDGRVMVAPRRHPAGAAHGAFAVLADPTGGVVGVADIAA